MSADDANAILEIDSNTRQYLTPIPSVYLASPLTGVSSEGRLRDTSFRRAIKTLLEANTILPMVVYDPADFTAPGSSHTPEEVFQTDQSRVVRSDLLMVLRTAPSDGVGIEIAIAGNAGVPIVLLEFSEIPVSRMTLGAPSRRLARIPFSNENDLIAGLRAELRPICIGVAEGMPAKRQLLEELAQSARGRDILRRRLRKGVSREQLAKRANCSAAWIKATETEEAFTLLLSQSMLWNIGKALCAFPSRGRDQRLEVLVDDDEAADRFANVEESLENLVEFVQADRRLDDRVVLRVWRDYHEMQMEAVAGRFEISKVISIDDWRTIYRNAKPSLGL